MNTFDHSLRAIDALCGGGFWVGATSQEHLQCYETLLNITFPEDYRYFFLTYGSGSKEGIEISGYDPVLISDNNVITRTILQLRGYYKYPKIFLFISDTGDGGQICFNTKTWKVLEVYKNASSKLGYDSQEIGDCFLDFLKQKFGR